MNLEALFGPEGALARSRSGYEPSPAQEAMVGAVWQPLERGGDLVVEASTGVGKRLADLLPAALGLPLRCAMLMGADNFPGQIKWDMILFKAFDHSYREYNDQFIQQMKNGMSDWSRQLLDCLVAAKRRNDSYALDPAVIRDRVAAYTPVETPARRPRSAPGDGGSDSRRAPADPDHGRVWARIGPIIGR